MMAEHRLHPAKNSKGKRPPFYPSPGLDQAMSMIMVLASEIAVMRDRIDASERVAKAHGLDLAAGIEMLQFDQSALDERETRRQQFFDRLFYLARKDASETEAAETEELYRSTVEDIAVG